ncbi:MAG: ABC transporter permease [Spirochaetales bacterium]|nr:ABC transporter permease [Spirochaetales bacterium]
MDTGKPGSKVNGFFQNVISSDLAHRLVVQFLSVLAALIAGAVVILLIGGNPVTAYRALIFGSMGNLKAIWETLVKATPLILTGLSFAYASRAGLINIGAEGQLYMGGFLATLVGTNFGWMPMIIHLPLTLLAGFLGGGVWGLIVGWLKIRFGANEIITTVMFNYIAIYFISYLVTGPMIEPPGTYPQSRPILESAILPRFFYGSRLHWGLFIALGAVVVYYFFFRKLKVGYESRVVGKSIEAAKYAGMKPSKVVIIVMFIAGGMGGLAGANEILAIQGKLFQGFSPGYGFDGIAVALVGMNSPIGIIFGGILFGALRSGGNMMQMIAKVPISTIYIIQGLVIVFVVAGQMITVENRKKLFGFIRRNNGSR